MSKFEIQNGYLSSYHGNGGDVIIPDTVTYIGECAFNNCTGLTSVNIPDSVTKIGDSAFYNCTGLTSVNIPDSVTKIGQRAFSGCTGLTSVKIPDSVTDIDYYAFRDCTGLTSVTIPDSVTDISGAFCECTGLTSITIPTSVTKIGDDAFKGCTGLTAINIPDWVTEIGNEAFYGCTGLTSVIVPNSVKILGFRAFYGCPSLKHISSPANILDDWPFPKESVETAVLTEGRYVSCHAFEGFTKLTSVIIPNTVLEIRETAFKQCVSLKEIVIPDSVTDIGKGAFLGCTDLVNVKMGNSIYRIEEAAFSSCSSLSSIEIPESVVRIRKNAFLDCVRLRSCEFADTQSWYYAPAEQYVYPYDKVEGTETDVTNPKANAKALVKQPNTVFFKKKASMSAPRSKPRFVTPVLTPSESSFMAQGQYFEYLTLDADTESSLMEQAKQIYIRHDTTDENDHDEYGRYTTSYSTDIPLTSIRSLTDPFSSINGDIIVVDGKIEGVIVCIVFRGYKDAYDEYIITLNNSPSDNDHLTILYVNGTILGKNIKESSNHSGRNWRDTTETYTLTTSPRPDSHWHDWK